MTEAFGPRLSRTRRAYGYSTRALAKALGISRVTISSWEHGRRVPRPWVQVRILAELERLPRRTPIVNVAKRGQPPRWAVLKEKTKV